MKLSERPLEDLVAALLAVNSYSFAQARALLRGLRQQRLLDVERIGKAKREELVTGLKGAGHDRGRITEIVAPRLPSLTEAVRFGGLDALRGVVEADDRECAEALLTATPGLGPSVAGTARMLLRSSASSEGRGGVASPEC